MCFRKAKRFIMPKKKKKPISFNKIKLVGIPTYWHPIPQYVMQAMISTKKVWFVQIQITK